MHDRYPNGSPKSIKNKRNYNVFYNEHYWIKQHTWYEAISEPRLWGSGLWRCLQLRVVTPLRSWFGFVHPFIELCCGTGCITNQVRCYAYEALPHISHRRLCTLRCLVLYPFGWLLAFPAINPFPLYQRDTHNGNAYCLFLRLHYASPDMIWHSPFFVCVSIASAVSHILVPFPSHSRYPETWIMT